MTGVRILPGVLIASSLIGAVVAAGWMLWVGVTEPGDRFTTLAWTPLILVAAVPIGFAVSILPNLLGAALLGWLGRGNVAARLPVMWALTGATAGGTLAAMIDGGHGSFVATLAATGAASALLCRWKITWTDDLPNRETCDEYARPRPARAVARSGRHATERWLD